MSRCLLHLNKFDEFVKWLDQSKIVHRPGKGEWQIIQIKKGSNWLCVYARAEMLEHFSVDKRLEVTIRSFIKSTNAQKEKS